MPRSCGASASNAGTGGPLEPRDDDSTPVERVPVGRDPVRVGIDVAAERLHCAALDLSGRLADARVFAPSEISKLLEWLEPARCVAIDAPSALSSSPHSGDPTLPPKFRTARCAEIALGREHSIWVPWVTPASGMPVPSWMRVGLRLFEAVNAHGHAAIEVYPHAGFRMLAGRRLAPKSTVEGSRARAELLRAAGVAVPRRVAASHDFLDAALAALVALGHSSGTATAVSCGHDDSAIWLP